MQEAIDQHLAHLEEIQKNVDEVQLAQEEYDKQRQALLEECLNKGPSFFGVSNSAVVDTGLTPLGGMGLAAARQKTSRNHWKLCHQLFMPETQ